MFNSDSVESQKVKTLARFFLYSLGREMKFYDSHSPQRKNSKNSTMKRNVGAKFLNVSVYRDEMEFGLQKRDRYTPRYSITHRNIIFMDKCRQSN